MERKCENAFDQAERLIRDSEACRHFQGERFAPNSCWPPEVPPSAPKFDHGHDTAVVGSMDAGAAMATRSPVHGLRVPSSMPSSSGGFAFKGGDAGVFVDALERENVLLRQQLDRCYAREKALRTETDDLRIRFDKLHLHQRSLENESIAAMSAKLAQESRRSNDLSAAMEALHVEREKQMKEITSLQSQNCVAQQEIDVAVRELEGLQKIVLPCSAALVECEFGEADSSLQTALNRLRRLVRQIRLACEATFETWHRFSEHLNPSPRACFSVPGFDSCRTSEGDARLQIKSKQVGPSLEQGQVRMTVDSKKEALQPSLCEAEHACAILRLERARSTNMEQQLTQANIEHLAKAKELDEARATLRLREAELRELQLVGKYFDDSHNAPLSNALSVATLADDLRGRCAALSQEVQRLSTERDLWRAQRDRAERGHLGWPTMSSSSAFPLTLPPTVGAQHLVATAHAT